MAEFFFFYKFRGVASCTSVIASNGIHWMFLSRLQTHCAAVSKNKISGAGSASDEVSAVLQFFLLTSSMMVLSSRDFERDFGISSVKLC